MSSSPLNVPHKPHHFISKKVAVLGIIFLGLVILSLIGTYYAVQTNSKAENKKVPPIAPTPTPQMRSLQTYIGDGFSFQYPGDKVSSQTETPESFRVIQPENQPWLRVAGKMFSDCDLYLTFPKHQNALIAVDVHDTATDGGFCWSYGYFKDDSTRKVVTLSLSRGIIRTKWRNPLGDYGDEKVWQDNWQGDYLQSTSFTGEQKMISFALLNQDGNRDETEMIFDQILSTFTFSETSPLLTPEISPTVSQEQVFCTMDAKLCPDGSSVGRSGPNCEFAACPQ